MPIIAPSLDDRRFDDLVEEMIARIPAHTPEWTHPRLRDPGRTLIQIKLESIGGSVPAEAREAGKGAA